MWYCSTLVGHNTLDNMPRLMTTIADINPHFRRNSIIATTVTAQYAANIENRHFNTITEHQSEASSQSYCDIRAVQNNGETSLRILQSGRKGKKNAVAVTQSAVAPPSAPSSQLPSAILVMEISLFSISFKTARRLLFVSGFVLGGTFHNGSLSFTVNFGDTSRK